MVYNGILMETMGIFVMVSIGLLLFLIAGLSMFIIQLNPLHAALLIHNITEKQNIDAGNPPKLNPHIITSSISVANFFRWKVAKASLKSR